MKKLLAFIPLLLLLASTKMFAIDCSTWSPSVTDSISGSTATFFASYTGGGSDIYETIYEWNFGDGTGSWDSAPAHTYSAAGVYVASLHIVILDASFFDSCVTTLYDTVVIDGGTIDCSTLSSSFSFLTGPGSVSCTATSTPSTYDMEYKWNFGDGSATYYGSTITHDYTIPGTYNITLTTLWISGADTCIHTLTSPVDVGLDSSAPINCDSVTASFSNSVTGGAAHFVVSNTPGYVMTYYWNFGDGTMTTAYYASTDHSYTSSGTYPISLTVLFTDAFGDSCIHSLTGTVTIGTGSIDCGALSTDFTDVVTGSSGSFTSSAVASGYDLSNSWDFGDGGTGYGTTASHTYTADGTYTVTLTSRWVDLGDTCYHTAIHTVTTPVYPASVISGDIYISDWTDSTESFYVWLITYDAATGVLTAVDSQYSTRFSSNYYYAFTGVPSGDYRVKAMMVGSVPGASGYVPTYHDSTTYWGDAGIDHHVAYTTDYGIGINMQYGTVTSGPGFIGGSVSAGAGKATDAGVANMLVYLRDAANHVLTYVYTDATGAYSFSGIATGTYNVYPEALNYATTPSATITLTATAPSSTDNSFRESTTLYTIKPVTTAVNNVAAASNAVKIFPNPATGTLHILWTAVDNNKHISVTDITGRELISTNADNATAQKDLDISSLAKGVYIVHITSANMDTTQKLVVE